MNKPKKKEDNFSTLSVYINKLYYMKHNETMNMITTFTHNEYDNNKTL